MTKNVYDFKVKTIDGAEETLGAHKGKCLLIVNVASECGFTKHYEGLQELHAKFKDKGFAVLGFPCNQFGAQEPGTDEEIKTFCSTKFNVTFPLYAKIDVNGDDAHPLYKFLSSEKPGFLGSKKIKWNFTKFLVDREGNPVKRYAPNATPESLTSDVEEQL